MTGPSVTQPINSVAAANSVVASGAVSTMDSAMTENSAQTIRESATVPKKKTYKAAFLEEKQQDEDFGNLLYQTEIYFGKPLTQSDINSLLYIYEELSFNPDLLEYLVEYCVSIGKKSCRYIEAVAIDWYKNGITSVEDAKVASKNYNSIYVAVLKQLGIPRRVPTPTETSFIDTWYNTYSFNKNIIMEACKRAITANPHSANFNYVNGILESWYKQNVHKLSDIEELDRKWAAEKKKKQTSGKVISNNQFNNYHNSTSDETIDELEQIFLQEANQ
jgi:DnaD/phage-associated family protein